MVRLRSLISPFAFATVLALGSCQSSATWSVDSVDPESLEEVHQGDGEPAATADHERDFSGVWRTSYGAMRLTQDGTRVHGTYSYSAGSQIEGEVDGRTLRSIYSEPDGTRGRAVFELAADGKSFSGVWRASVDEPLALNERHASKWRGTRVEPVPGRVWLVILEAHWEESLDEHEYSYGAMLRSFFERVPNVEVRHRFFHDRADFVRFCQDVATLAEPVVVYISSHGSPEGIEAHGDHIDGKTIGEALRGAGELRLLHLGGCALLGGDLGEQVLASAAPHAPFPITGFKVSVDWAGSAIVDFTYLDLVLEHEMAPAAAVATVRSMISFAGPPSRHGDPIAGTDLTVLRAEE